MKYPTKNITLVDEKLKKITEFDLCIDVLIVQKLSTCGEPIGLKTVDFVFASESLKSKTSEVAFSNISYRLSNSCFSITEYLYSSMLQSVEKKLFM